MHINWIRDKDQDRCDNSYADSGRIFQLVASEEGWEVYRSDCPGGPFARFRDLKDAQRWAKEFIQRIVTAYGPQEEITDQSIEDTIRRLREAIDDIGDDESPQPRAKEGGSRASDCEAGTAPGAPIGSSAIRDPGCFSVMGMVAVRTRGGIGRLEVHLPGGIAPIGLQTTIRRGQWCREHAGRIIAALVDLGLRGELEDCEVWMQADRPQEIRVVICKSQGELRFIVNDEERLRTLIDLPLLSGLGSTDT